MSSPDDDKGMVSKHMAGGSLGSQLSLVATKLTSQPSRNRALFGSTWAAEVRDHPAGLRVPYFLLWYFKLVRRKANSDG